MKTLVHFLLCACLLSSTSLLAQTEETTPKKKRTTIIIKTIDEDGTENTQTITKEGEVLDFKTNANKLDFQDLDIFIKKAKKGDKLRIELEGDVQKFNFDASDFMAFNRADCDQPFLGIMMISTKTFDNGTAIHGQVDQKGVLINEIIKDTGAEDAGLLANDVLTKIDGKPMTTLGGVIEEIKSHNVNDQVTVTYLRNGQEMQVVATLKGKKCPAEKVAEIEEIIETQVAQIEEKEMEIEILTDKIMQIKKEKDAAKAAAAAEKIANATEEDRFVNLAPQQKQTLALEEIEVFPNPSIGWVTLSFNALPQATSISVIDISGREIYREELPNFDGNYRKEIDIRQAAKGTLLLNIVQGEKVHTEKIIFN